MKKSIFLFFAAIMCAVSINAANMTGGEVLYLKPNSNWTQFSAWFAIYLCNGSSPAEWVKMEKVGDYYQATVPAGKNHKNVIFCRMNSANTTKLDWSNKWNQSGDLSFDQKKNLCTINNGQWDCGSNVVWSTYQPVSNASLATSAANLFVGAQATLTPSLSSNANVNTIKSTSYSVSPATGSVTNNKFTATAAGEYTVTATVTYYPNGCTSLTSSGLKTATATTTIVAEVPAEETHDVTVSYLCGSTKVADPITVNTVGVETPVKVTAPEIAKYTFSNWILGADVTTEDALTNTDINITTKAGGSDFTLTANYEKAKLTYTVTVPAGTENCYLVGAMNGWNVANPIEMTKQGENVFTTTLEGVATTDEYKYISQKGSWDYADVQEANRTWTANDVVTAWKDPLATNVHLVGNMFANWDKTPDKEFRKATKDATTANIVVNLDANKEYELKVRRGDDWTSCTSKITNTVSNLQFSTSNNDNCKMKTTVAGDYTFTWTISSSKLAVTYPTICAITATANDAAMGTIAGAGDYGKGSTATLTATPNDGYLFVNWTKGGEEVATTQEYSFKVTEAVELVANFEAAPEEVHNVTVSYKCGSNKIAEDQTVAAVGETSAKTVEAPAIFGYTFSSWTLGAGVTSADETANPISINIVAGASDYTLTANYTEIPKVKIYVVNNKKWSKVNVYGWKDGEAQGTPAWPGQEITANLEAEKVAGFDVYSYSVVPGSYDNLILNNGSGEQTGTYKWTDGKYYYVGATENYAGGTAEDVTTILAPDPLATGVYLAGDMTNKDNWDVNKKEFKKETAEATTASVTVTLAAQTYKFKLVVGGAWKGNTGTMTRGGESVHEGGWQFDADGYDDNCQIVADIAGDYTFTWNLTDKKLTVAYPPLPKYTVTATAENGSVTGAGEYEQGSKATLVATPNTGYAFQNWTKGSEVVSTEATYTFTVTEAVTLVANFVPEETHEVTVSYLCNGTTIPDQAETKLAVGVTTPSTISAPTIKNYKFDRWTLGTGVQSEDATTANPIQIITLASGDYTLAANYTKIELTYNVTVPAGTPACYIAGEMNSWTLTEMTKVDDTHYTITIDGATTEHKYKYSCGNSWDYVELKVDGSEVADRSYSENDVVEKWSTLAKCYLMGNGDWVNGVEMEYDSENGQYILLCHHISAPFKFKLGDEWSDQVENNTENGVTWTDEDADGNFDINLPEGDYNFYFKKDSKKAYIEVSTPTLNRTVPVGYYATVCLSQNIIKVVGATLFEVAGKDGNKVIFDEVLTPVAGMPYIFLAEENTISFYCGIETAATPGNHKSLHGTFEDMVDAELDGMYMVQNNKIVKCAATGCNIPANRAYFNGTELDALGVPPAPMPGRRRITMGAEGENTTTGVEGIIVPEGQTIKVISNGQLIIIHNGEMYNAQGIKL